MRRYLTALLTPFLLSCDIDFNIPVDQMDWAGITCGILNPGLQQCAEAYSTFDIPREQNEPCGPTAPCVDELLCACGICLDPFVITPDGNNT